MIKGIIKSYLLLVVASLILSGCMKPIPKPKIVEGEVALILPKPKNMELGKLLKGVEVCDGEATFNYISYEKCIQPVVRGISFEFEEKNKEGKK